jgi:hypothetical protein
LSLHLLTGVLLVVLLLAGPTAAEPDARQPLPPDVQGQVNAAIDRGAAFLLATQNAGGTWGGGSGPGRTHGHMIGYTALCALTLLECGVQPNHPSVQKAARVIRKYRTTLDTTYELALSVLFLDRLGEPDDGAVIETFALRLIAGQTPSGGWSYRCPPLHTAEQKQLLVVLRQLNPTGGIVLLPRDLGKLKLTDKDRGYPGDLRPTKPTLTDLGKLKPARAKDIAYFKQDDKHLPDVATPKPGPRLPRQVGEGSQWGGSYRPGEEGRLSRLTPRPGQCIKIADRPEPGPDPEEPKPEKRPDPDKGVARQGAKPDDNKPDPPGAGPDPAKVVIPPALVKLPVLQNPRWLVGWIDPQEQLEVPTFGTTDNSNSQFAILGLWVAQRHGVPMDRTMTLLERRYRLSQNLDGGWGYRYLPAGGVSSTSAMTCVGLIGLAVSHGLAAQGQPARAPANDPAIVNGFVALSRSIGDPTGRTEGAAMQNLYYLWSLERVAVLYNLRTIGNKDWYRWGAEVLLSNQLPSGGWTKGGYPGAHPILDSCLALLFLRRANLAADLTERLPFNPERLNEDIGQGQRREGAGPPQPSAPPPSGPPPAPPPLPAPDLKRPETEAPPAPVTTPPTFAQESRDAPPESGGGRKWWLVILIAAGVLLLGGGGAACWFGRTRDEPDEKRRRKRKGKK